MTHLVEILIVVVPVVIVAILAVRFGVDSRDGLDWTARRDWTES
jgi:hypothetical protein